METEGLLKVKTVKNTTK